MGSGIPGKPPAGYGAGTEYTKEEIDEALALGETRADALFRLWISADTGLLCLESQPETEGLPVV